jgi:hypothetical protein
MTRGPRGALVAGPAVAGLAAVILALIVLAGSATAGAAAPGVGTISGTVTNHTGPPRPLAGQPIRLTAYVNGAEQDWKETASDARGRFSFTVPVDPQRTYVAWLHYKDGEYTSAPVILKTAGQRASVSLRVWEPTSDAGVLRVNVHHIIVEPGQGAVRVAELLVVVNSTDRTYVGVGSNGSRRQSLQFSLPDGARDVQLMDGLYERAVTVSADALIDSVGVKPGMREIAYSYTVPITGRTMALGRRVDYPTERLEVFGRAGATLSVAPLVRQDDVKTDQGSYARYSGGPVEAGRAVRIGLTGLPVRRPTARYAAIAVFLGLMAAAVVYPFLRRSRPSGEPRRTRQSRDDLIQAVAALDDRFEAGEVSEADYRRRRARYMERLRALAG